MIDEFIPPIKERSTEQLLEIVAEPTKWESRAVILAREELRVRNIDDKKVAQKKYIIDKEYKYENLKKARESYDFLDFILFPQKIFGVILSFELKKDGYIRKAEQRKIILVVFALIVLLFYIFYKLY